MGCSFFFFFARSSIVGATLFFTNSLYAGSQNNMSWNVLHKLLKAGLKLSEYLLKINIHSEPDTTQHLANF